MTTRADQPIVGSPLPRLSPRARRVLRAVCFSALVGYFGGGCASGRGSDRRGGCNMPVPRRRHSPARKGHDRAHKKLAEKGFSECPRCHAVKQPHRVCPSCGYYKDRAYVVKVKS